jgi:hypothetical protein
MSLLRRHLGSLAVAWLVLQAASLSAVAASDCCGSPSGGQACQRAVAAHCPMRSAGEMPCPMHRENPASASSSSQSSSTDCALRASCDHPAAALLVLLVHQGVLTTGSAFSVHLERGVSVEVTDRKLSCPRSTPDAPPPRA